jgi:hypothetical protein
MEPKSELIRPTTFETGREYLFLEQWSKGRKGALTPVKFYTYDPCPAFVIVRTEMGNKWRCPRDELFVPAFTS